MRSRPSLAMLAAVVACGPSGTVNRESPLGLSPSDARALFNWTEPQLPQGWHGVWATAQKPGTRNFQRALFE